LFEVIFKALMGDVVDSEIEFVFDELLEGQGWGVEGRRAVRALDSLMVFFGDLSNS
jgi:hypothetical protein